MKTKKAGTPRVSHTESRLYTNTQHCLKLSLTHKTHAGREGMHAVRTTGCCAPCHQAQPPAHAVCGRHLNSRCNARLQLGQLAAATRRSKASSEQRRRPHYRSTRRLARVLGASLLEYSAAALGAEGASRGLEALAYLIPLPRLLGPKGKAVDSAALEAAGASSQGSGWAPGCPASSPGSAAPPMGC